MLLPLGGMSRRLAARQQVGQQRAALRPSVEPQREELQVVVMLVPAATLQAARPAAR